MFCRHFGRSVFNSVLSFFLCGYGLSPFCECKAADPIEPKVTLIGDRSFRVCGTSMSPIVVTDKHAAVSDQYGEITVFDLASGEVVNVGLVDLDGEDYVADVAYSHDGQLFAVAFGRRIEIRKVFDPKKVVASFSLTSVSQDDHYFTPTAEIEFDRDGSRLFAYDSVGSTLLEFSLSTGKSRKIATGLSEDTSFKLSVSSADGCWLSSPQELIFVGKNEPIKRYPVAKGHRFHSVAATDFSVFVVFDLPSKGWLESAGRILVEHDQNTFAEVNRWDCDCETVAIVNQRPVFRKDRRLLVGTKDGKTKELTDCRADVQHLMGSTDGKYVVAAIGGGLCLWDTARWKPNVQSTDPYQTDQLFCLNNEGALMAVTQSYILQSTEMGSLTSLAPMPDDVSHLLDHQCLSANGGGFVYVDSKYRVHHLTLADSRTVQLEMPNNGRPNLVSIDETGMVVAVQYSPTPDTPPESQREANDKAFQQGITEGILGGLARSTKQTNSCAVFQLPSQKPIANARIGENAMLVGSDGFRVDTNTGVLWVGSYNIGNWDYHRPTQKPNSRSTGPQETIGCSACNSLGDVVCRKMDSRSENVVARIMWYGAKQRRPIELAIEKKQLGNKQSSFVAAQSGDHSYVYLGESIGYKSTIIKMKLPTKEILWKIELPSRLIAIRLSPNERFLGAKLSDSRYAIIQID
jgi:hypothetical protein